MIAHEARQWINSVGWKTHLKSEIHVRALKHEEDTLERASQINRATEAALADDIQNTRTDFALLTATSSSFTHAPPKQTPIVSANEQAMWESLDMEDITFSAGLAPDDTTDRRRVERELKDADMWDGMNLLGGFSDDNPIFDDQEDEVLAEALRNAGEQYLMPISFPHPPIRDMPTELQYPDTADVQEQEMGDSSRDADHDWFPYNTKTVSTGCNTIFSVL